VQAGAELSVEKLERLDPTNAPRQCERDERPTVSRARLPERDVGFGGVQLQAEERPGQIDEPSISDVA
jgi:hypothetical protein